AVLRGKRKYHECDRRGRRAVQWQWLRRTHRRQSLQRSDGHADPQLTTRFWWSELTPVQRRALIAAMAGWMFDSMDFLIYVLAIGRLQSYFGFDAATAGLLGTMTLVSAAAGGLIFGVVAD